MHVLVGGRRFFGDAARRRAANDDAALCKFIDDLALVTESGALFEVDRQYEIGFEFGTEPRMRLWGIPLPKLKISYVFGDDFKGIKLRL